MSRHRAVTLAAVLILAVPLAACRDSGAVSAAAGASAGSATSAVRDAALARAKVWMPPDVSPGAADFGANTRGPDAFDANADIDCTFLTDPVGGSTPKFRCALPDGRHLKVKYGVQNGELPAEVAGTRLLNALGFPADRMNLVHSVRCHGCPLLPQQALQCLEKGLPRSICLQAANADTVVTFAPAVIEQPIKGKKIEAAEDQGWSWFELEKIDPHAGGSTRAQVDALRLVAILLAHWDNKGANQKLICPPDAEAPDGTCRTPIAVIGDLGGTFGPRKVDLTNWRQVPIWVDAPACRVGMTTLPYAGATFREAQISEEGRRFALTLLRALTREQLDTLFTESGVTSFPHVLAEAHQARAWTDTFLDKVRQIEAGGPCPQ